jgi:small-conductance mechanosensitive channel
MSRRPTTGRIVLGLALLVALAAGGGRAQDEPVVVDERVEADVDRGADARIETRLRATFGRLDGLAGVDVSVRAGVVELTGTVPSASARTLAGALATQVLGVSAVENSLETDRSVRRRLGAALDTLEVRLWELVGALPLLAVAVLVFVVFTALGRFATRWERPYRRLGRNTFVRDLIRQAVRGGFLVAGALLALEVLDATALVGAVLGAAGLAGLAIGFAFRDLVENYIASVLLSLRQPFLPNDHVRIEGVEGKVVRLTSRASILLTLDGNHVRIPNAIVFKAVIENYSRNPLRRFSFPVGAGVDEDLVAAQDLGVGILRSMDGVLADPEPFALVEELGDSTVTVRFFGWVDQRQADFLKVRSEAIRLVKQGFDEAGIDMPEPIQRVRLEDIAARAPGAPTAQRATTRTRDVAVDRHLEDQIEEERAAEPDLLSDEAEVE